MGGRTIMDYSISILARLIMKFILMMDSFLTDMQLFASSLTDGLERCDVSISCLDSHSDGTHSLQSIH